MTYTERVGSSLRSRGRKGIGKKWLREGGVRAFLPVSLSLLPVSLGIPLSGAKTEIACGEMKTNYELKQFQSALKVSRSGFVEKES